jgi:hypothetical protein
MTEVKRYTFEAYDHPSGGPPDWREVESAEGRYVSLDDYQTLAYRLDQALRDANTYEMLMREERALRETISSRLDRIKHVIERDVPAGWSQSAFELDCLRRICEIIDPPVVEIGAKNSGEGWATLRFLECGHEVSGPELADLPTLCLICRPQGRPSE